MQSLQFLTPSHYRRVPWKNGLGSTLEIATDAAEPCGPWTWRLSLADVPTRAPFSAFPGIDRHLAVLDGAGMTLERAAERIEVPREGRAFSFAGEDTITGTPVGSGVRDANLMLDRAKWTGSLEIQRVHERRSIEVEGDVVLIFAAQTSDFLRCATKEESCVLSADSTLLSTGLVRLEASHCTLVIARIDARARSNVGNP
jgi:environmental stress-induced protein Ves